jgi:flagellar biosynthesis/type III secretory pathway chaperone
MSIQPAIDLLSMMRTLHESLIELATQKTKALIANEIDTLMKITRQENKLVKQIQETDHQRRLFVAQYLHVKGFPVQYTITVSEFSKYVFQPEEKKALLDEQEALLDTLNRLKQLNETNQMLIGDALNYVNFSIDLLTLAGDDIVYKHPHQQTNPTGRSNLFDSKA